MTITMNANIFPSALTFGPELGKETLQELVNLGICAKVDNHQEHYAIQPVWINDPASGVLHEIKNYVLGRLNKSLNAYVVAVKNIRNSETSAGMNEDHRWLHVNITATYYTYTPEEGQQLKGEIKKIGNRAAICVLFDSFNATVFAKDETELASWTVGDELCFEIYSFSHKRKGPIIRAKSIAGPGSTKTKKKTFSDVDFDDYEPLTMSNGVGYSDPKNQSLSEEESQSSKKEKKKKKRKIKEEPEEYATQTTDLEDINLWGNESSGVILNQSEDMDTSTESPRKKKKKSKVVIKQEVISDDDGHNTDTLENINLVNSESLRAIQEQFMDPDDESSPSKKKKKKKKSSHHE